MSIRAVLSVVAIVAAQQAWSLTTIISPAPTVPLRAGPDYATDVLGDPWDMSNFEDISIDPDQRAGWATFGFNNGVVGGKTKLTVQGFPDSSVTFLTRPFVGVINPGRHGGRYPIDSTAYKKVAWKMYSSITDNTDLPKVTWYQNPRGGADEVGATFANSSLTAGWKIYMPTDVNAAPIAPVYKKWDAKPILGFQLGPSAKNVGFDAFFDWVRITRSDDDPFAVKMTITWTATQTGTGTLVIADASGAELSINTGQPRQYQFNYGILPPGTYTMKIVVNGDVSAPVPFTINNPPLVQVVEPNETGGEDFATKVLGNAWDMNESTDVDTLSNIDPASLSFSGGILNAKDTNGDGAVNFFNRDTAVTIDSSRYRFLTYRMKIDGAYSLGGDDGNGGSITRLFWSAFYNPTANQVTNTQDIFAYPGVDPNVNDFVTYTIDLSSLTVANGGINTDPPTLQQPWTANKLKNFRIDPHEFKLTRPFHFDYVKLAAMAEAQGAFTLKYSASDQDAKDQLTAKVNLYYTPDKNPANHVLIAQNLPLSATGQFVWNVSSVPRGTYWIYAEVTDGTDVRGQYSTGQVKTLGGVPKPIVADVDGDGIADASTDGLMIVRYLFGLTGEAVTAGAIGSGAARQTTADVMTYLNTIRPQLDIDGNSNVDALTDGLLIVRYMFNLRGTALTNWAVGGSATRSQSQIETYLQSITQ